MSRLDEILAATRERVKHLRQEANVRAMEKAASAHTPRGFRKRLHAMAQLGPAVIAELKKASPSKGVIRGTFPVGVLANQVARAGASALSVLTDEPFFHGSLANLLEASAATDLPCLRKDFIVDEFQILESRANHADAILLILSALDDKTFRGLLDRAEAMELDVLCEVHDQDELRRALEGGADIIGVNSRDLKTFQVSLHTLIDMVESIPSHVLKIAESGIDKGSDIKELHQAGYQAFLIGEALMRAEDPGQKLQQLFHDAGWYSPSASASPNWRGTVQ
ncbi:MAG TPA: indole-3-glycerol phosphate synthase TrpC [Candidatus Angelobacter sp.]|jgi:indole-3-glycerol phosphate synthase|nr:indole-3-glycerol phosphate synthase TrpC [Candidatus Angelobacter sp.]